jgi:hypothetical protein
LTTVSCFDRLFGLIKNLGRHRHARVLLPGEPDTTSAEEKQEVMNAVQQTMENIMAKHNTVVLNMFRQMMVSVFGPGMEKVLNRVSPQGPSGETRESSVVVNGQPAQDASAQPPPRSMGGQPIQQQNPYQAVPNQPTYGEWHSTVLEFHLALLTG